jgi:hypothetical protein
MSRRIPPRNGLIPALLAAALISGCGTVRLEVPPGRNVRMLEADEPAEIHVERTLWYWMWGGNAISDNTPAFEIEKYDLKEVRVHTEQTFIDSILNPITAVVSIVRRRLIVEGNTERALRRSREVVEERKVP